MEVQYTNPNSEQCIPIGPFPIGCHTELISEKDIEFILSQYNFFNLEWKDDAETTRSQVPETLRRNGLWITYTHLGERVTERFIGTDMQAQIPEDWKNDVFWEKLDFEQILNSAEDAFITILRNLDKYPKFKDFLSKLLGDLLKNELSLDDLKDLIELHLEEVLKSMIPSGYLNALINSITSQKIQEYINSPAFKNNLKNVLKELLKETIDDLDCVLGPDGAVDGNIVIFDGNSGKLIADSCISIDKLRTIVNNWDKLTWIFNHYTEIQNIVENGDKITQITNHYNDFIDVVEAGPNLWDSDENWLWPKQSNKNIWVSNINAEGKIIQQGSGQYPNNSPSYIQD